MITCSVIYMLDCQVIFQSAAALRRLHEKMVGDWSFASNVPKVYIFFNAIDCKREDERR